MATTTYIPPASWNQEGGGGGFGFGGGQKIQAGSPDNMPNLAKTMAEEEEEKRRLKEQERLRQLKQNDLEAALSGKQRSSALAQALMGGG